jgi:hypothetical protein
MEEETLMEDLLESMDCISPKDGNDLENKFISSFCPFGLRPYGM